MIDSRKHIGAKTLKFLDVGGKSSLPALSGWFWINPLRTQLMRGRNLRFTVSGQFITNGWVRAKTNHEAPFLVVCLICSACELVICPGCMQLALRARQNEWRMSRSRIQVT